MEHPGTISISNFDYPLTEQKIAKYPLKQRDTSKLLVYQNGEIKDQVYHQIGSSLPNETLLIFNNTKVVQARLHFVNRNGRTIELFCLEPAIEESDITLAMAKKGNVDWICLVGGAKKWKEDVLTASFFSNNEKYKVQVQKVERDGANFKIRFEWDAKDLSFSEILELIGKTPLPPYMKRNAEDSDKDRYQTVFATYDGSVAAPTSGLHFTQDLIQQLGNQGIQKEFVTLHVGAGTFKPVSSDLLDGHDMHFEFIQVSKSAIQSLIDHISKPIIPVGTTSMRTIESLYWLGLKVIQNPVIPIEELYVKQWDPYELDATIDTKTALSKLVEYLEMNKMNSLLTRTQLMIAPGYTYKVAQGLITNFHQPKSTLLLLVSALIGDDWKAMYQHALDNEYRFLSYGDGCLLLP